MTLDDTIAPSVPASVTIRAAVGNLLRSRLLRSLVMALLVGFGVLVIAFSLIRFIPGDPALIALGDQATPESLAQYRHLLGIDAPVGEQFLNYVSGVLHGDLGTSLATRQPVRDMIARRLPVTFGLIGVTVIMALIISLPLGTAIALYRRSWVGQVFRISSSIILAMPVFFTGVVAILVFAIGLNVAPVAGYRGIFPQNLRYLWLPALVLCGVLVPILSRVLQSSILNTLEQEFVETAIVRGLPRRVFFWHYLLRPSLAPTIALLGYMVGALLGAAVVIELVFNLPGIGTALIDAVLNRDYSMVQGIIFVFGLLVVIVSLISELINEWLDPRTR